MLIKADTEQEVIDILKHAGYWDDAVFWRPYGDNESNYSIIGNQQARSDAALVEKVVNSVDARLLNECLAKGIDPEGPEAPTSIQSAVARFFEPDLNPTSRTAGRLEEWPDSKRTDVARGITLAATGFGPKDGRPCFSLADSGEGQTPDRFPETFLSLPEKSNKLRIPFVQGKFNMGGTGALRFCGTHNLQLIVSRRNPALVHGKQNPADLQWGFTVVRRQNPIGAVRSSVYTYLAPTGCDHKAGLGGVLRFTAESMPIFPEGRDAFGRLARWGTLIKLYEYSASGYSNTHILRKDGLLARLDLLLPEIALPVRLHECRPQFKGHEGSFETTLSGLTVRLEDDKAENAEPGFPTSSPISAGGERMTVTTYAFKSGRADTYRKNEGIVFTVNGQTHGYLGREFFSRKSVGLSYLADSLLIFVDCSEISGRAREDLFMASRDRLSKNDLYYEIESALEELLKQHDGLRTLKERRRREELESRLGDERPLEDVLESLLKQYPTLSTLFLKGQRATNPFKTDKGGPSESPYNGERYPTFFRFKGKEYGLELARESHINMRCRIAFETDAVNDYFSRNVDRGDFRLHLLANGNRAPVSSYVGPNLQNGVATLSVQLPANCCVGDQLRFLATVSDATRIEPFENRFTVMVKGAVDIKSGGKSSPRSDKKQSGDSPVPAGIALPNIKRVKEAEWEAQKPAFDKYTALRIKHAGVAGDRNETGGTDIYDFFVNVDNLFLKTELKARVAQREVLTARFIYGLVLFGLGLIQEDARSASGPTEENGSGTADGNGSESVEKRVERATRAVAPVLLPMIEALGGLQFEPGVELAGAGEEG